MLSPEQRATAIVTLTRWYNTYHRAFSGTPTQEDLWVRIGIKFPTLPQETKQSLFTSVTGFRYQHRDDPLPTRPRLFHARPNNRRIK